MEHKPVDLDSFGVYLLNSLGELQARMLRFPDRRSAMLATMAQLRLRAGCWALVAQMRQETWVSCTVYALTNGQLGRVSTHRRHGVAVTMDVNAVPPSGYAGSSLGHTMDII